jgi:hypothetical protein
MKISFRAKDMFFLWKVDCNYQLKNINSNQQSNKKRQTPNAKQKKDLKYFNISPPYYQVTKFTQRVLTKVFIQ